MPIKLTYEGEMTIKLDNLDLLRPKDKNLLRNSWAKTISYFTFHRMEFMPLKCFHWHPHVGLLCQIFYLDSECCLDAFESFLTSIQMIRVQLAKDTFVFPLHVKDGQNFLPEY